MDPNTSVTKIGLNSLHWFLRYGVHKVIGMHRLTQSLVAEAQKEVTLT